MIRYLRGRFEKQQQSCHFLSRPEAPKVVSQSVPYSLIAASGIQTGWMFPRGLSTRLVRWCTGVCTDRHLATSQTSSQPLMLHPVVFVYNQPTVTVSLYLAVDSARNTYTAVGRSTTSARQSGTRYQMNLEIQTVLITLNGS